MTVKYKHTSSKYFEIMSQQGRTPSVTPGAGSTQIQFLLNSLPTQKDSKFWYYAEAILVKVVATIVLPTDTAFAGIRPEYLWKVISSMEVSSPILGSLFASQNTRGAVLGNVISPVAMGYRQFPQQNLLGAGGNATVQCELYYRIPLAHDFLDNRMDTAPWTGLLEGGFVNVNVAQSTVLTDVLASTSLSSVQVSCSLVMQPEPEARVHTPIQWREHICPGNSTRFTITDMGSPDGLQGIDQSMGVGIAGLFMLTGPSLTGLSAGVVADTITALNVPWRDQQEIYNPELPVVELLMQANTRSVRGTGGIAVATAGDMGWPHLNFSAVPNGAAAATSFNNANLLVYPVIAPGGSLYTSKAQTVAGSKDMNFQFTSTPSPSQRFVGCYLPVFDEQFAKSLAARIAPGSEGKLVAKLLNKQDASKAVRRVGKFAYTPDKIVG